MGENYLNIVAKFGKSLDMSVLPHLQDEEKDRTWMILGYFDTLEILPLPNSISGDSGNDSWLERIDNYNGEVALELDGSFYFHPLHLFAKAEQERAAQYEAFWKEKSPYLLFSLVQTSIAEWSSLPRGDHFSCVEYYSLGLSDRVLIWKGDCLVDMLDALRSFFNQEEYGITDINTFPAIHNQFLRESGWRKNTSCQIRSWDDDESRIYVSSRYVAKDCVQKERYVEQIKEYLGADKLCHTFFSSGMEDLFIVLPDITLVDYLEILNMSLFGKAQESYRQAFSESITQVGLKFVNRGCSVAPQKRWLTQFCAKLMDDFHQFSCRQDVFEEKGKRDSWRYSAQGLYSTLFDMSGSEVMDELCILIADAANTFYENVLRIYVNRPKEPLNREIVGGNILNRPISHYTEQIQRFVRGWNNLVEQVPRTDGRFTQMPGYSPALFEIPARLLEYYLSFSIRFAETVSNNRNTDEGISMLLVPKMCRRVKVHSIFYGKNERPERGLKHLLYVDIPMGILYDPFSVLCALGHEVSHYVGGAYRNREERMQLMIQSTAAEIANRFGWKSKRIIQAIAHNLSETMEELEKDKYYFNSALSQIKMAAVTVLIKGTGEEYFNSWRALAFDEAGFLSVLDEAKKEISISSARIELLEYIDDFLDHLSNIGYLFREGYADLSMIYVLQPTRDQYLMLVKDELDILSENVNSHPEDIRYHTSYYSFVQRWGALLSLNELWKGECEYSMWIDGKKKLYDGAMGAFLEDIAMTNSDNIWDNKQTGPLNTNFTYDKFIEYLRLCYLSLANGLERRQDLSILRHSFQRVGKERSQDWEDYRVITDWYKDKIRIAYDRKKDGN